MKKLLGLILTLIIIMALASCDFLNNGLPNNEAGNSNNNGDIPEFDDSEYSSEGVIYSISADNTYAEVAGYNGNAEKVKIDSEYNGLPVKNIYDSAFRGNKTITSVVIPDSVTSIGSGAFICNSLNQITVTEENAFYKSIEGNLYTKDGKKLLQYAIGKDATEFYIPDSVTSIGDRAFENCSALTSVVIPDSVTHIDQYAFKSCTSLTSVVIPDSVTSIDNYAFVKCSALTSAIIGNSVTSIGNYAFYGCDSLTSVVIPDSVTSIGNYAFYYCDALTDVYYTGSEEEWSKISISEYNEELQNATIHYNYVSAE